MKRLRHRLCHRAMAGYALVAALPYDSVPVEIQMRLAPRQSYAFFNSEFQKPQLIRHMHPRFCQLLDITCSTSIFRASGVCTMPTGLGQQAPTTARARPDVTYMMFEALHMPRLFHTHALAQSILHTSPMNGIGRDNEQYDIQNSLAHHWTDSMPSSVQTIATSHQYGIERRGSGCVPFGVGTAGSFAIATGCGWPWTGQFTEHRA